MDLSENLKNQAIVIEKLSNGIKRFRELDNELKELCKSNSEHQKELTRLQIEEKSLKNEIKICKPCETARKIKISQSIPSSVKAAFKNLTDEEKKSMVDSLLEALL